MSKSSEEKFQKALEICKSLATLQRQHSTLPCEAIQLFCEIGQEPSELLYLCQRYASEIEPALKAVEQYARSIDNWRSGDCPFGAKDHCNILHFFLNFYTKKFDFFRGKNFTPELICEFLKEWKGIDLYPVLDSKAKALL